MDVMRNGALIKEDYMNFVNIAHTLCGEADTAHLDFGAHFSHEYEQDGVRFTVYAPNALSVSLIGEFNDWCGYAMDRYENGVWSIFVKDVFEGAMYKYRIETYDGKIFDRSDPFAFYSEKRPDTASRVYDVSSYCWDDEEWLQRRTKNFDAPMNIYEVHLGSWKKNNNNEFLSYNELADELIHYVKELGATHIELMPLTEHPLDASWGYQTTGYFSATSRYGEPRALMAFIDRCHAEGIGVILDFVPVHFASDYTALAQFDGGYVYESDFEDKRYSEWGSPLFDFTKPYVVSFLRSSLEFWTTVYHFDGVRFDAVANLIYNNGRGNDGLNESGLWFIRLTNYLFSKKHPDIMLIAEDSSIYPKVTAPAEYGGLGFDYKWDLGWMNNTLCYLSLPFSHRAAKQSSIHHTMSYFYNECYILPLSHDEVVHGKKQMMNKIYGTKEQKLSQLKLLYMYMISHPGKKLCFMGNELLLEKEWSETSQLDMGTKSSPDGKELSVFLKKLYEVYLENKALFEGEYNPSHFNWLDYQNNNGIFAFTRSDNEGGYVAVFLNFSENFTEYRLSCPKSKRAEVLISTDKKLTVAEKIEGGRAIIKSPAFSGVIIKLI